MFQLVKENNYEQEMQQVVDPFLAAHGGEQQIEREPGHKLSYVKYLAENPKGVMMISHGFTESAEKYKEICYYFLREGYHVYMPDHCGHGKSYRLTEDPSLVYVDGFQRYFDDFINLTRLAEKEQPGLPVYLYGHSMGGGIAAACAAQYPQGYKKVLLSSPMICPLTNGIPLWVSRVLAEVSCLVGKKKSYVMGTHPYQPEKFEESASGSLARFTYYKKKRDSQKIYQTCAPSFGWVRGAMRLNRYLQKTGYRLIKAPVLLMQAGKDTLVSNEEQNLFIRKINETGQTKAEIRRFEESKHEIFNAVDAVAEPYWEAVFRYFGE